MVIYVAIAVLIICFMIIVCNNNMVYKKQITKSNLKRVESEVDEFLRIAGNDYLLDNAIDFNELSLEEKVNLYHDIHNRLNMSDYEDSTIQEIKLIDKRFENAKMNYEESIKKYNSHISKFPRYIIAKVFANAKKLELVNL